MREVAFGQYYPSNSFVHKMNASVKILLVIAYIVGVFLVKEFHYLGQICCLSFVVFVSILAKIPFFKMLKSLKAIMFFVVFSAVLQLFLNKNGARDRTDFTDNIPF